MLEIEFQNSVLQWRVSAFITLQDWHHIGCSWHPIHGLTCLVDLSTMLKGNESIPLSRFGAFTLGMSTIVPKSFVNASFSNLAVWEKKLTSSDFQGLYHCAGLTPRKC